MAGPEPKPDTAATIDVLGAAQVQHRRFRGQPWMQLVEQLTRPTLHDSVKERLQHRDSSRPVRVLG